MSKVNDYRECKSALPAENLAWRLYGAGLESFGDNGEPSRLSLPEYGPEELLSRVDAVGLCFSDIKLINQGSTHPRVHGRDLVKTPAIPGHEVSITIVGVGETLKDKFKVGERYVVQADVYYKGINRAYGYWLPGGMQQYGVLGEEILRGDEGCYLIPIQDGTGYAEAALAEPWACVVASYRIKPRRTMKEGGTALFVGPAKGSGYTLPAGPRPSKVIFAGVDNAIDRSQFGDAEIIEIGQINGSELTALSQERTGAEGFDDIIVLGRSEPELIEALDKHAAQGSVICYVGCEGTESSVTIDVGRVHYDAVLYVSGNDIAEAYGKSRDSEMLSGGTAWFIGAAGPMGQMHVERAVQMNDAPSKILATDVDTSRLEALRDRVAGMASEKGIEIEFMNPLEVGNDRVAEVAAAMTGGKGFDDVVVLAPVAGLIAQGSENLADGGLMNIFAGVPRGTMAKMDITSVCKRGTGWVGSSGSRPDDLEFTLRQAECGNLATNRSVAAIGGIDAVGDGVKAVKEAKFPGKTVIFPQIANLPLTAVPDLKNVLPSVAEKLEEGKFWTREAEEELLRAKLG